jgi:hypothetical protein
MNKLKWLFYTSILAYSMDRSVLESLKNHLKAQHPRYGMWYLDRRDLW